MRLPPELAALVRQAAAIVYPAAHSVAPPATANAYTTGSAEALHHGLASNEPDARRWLPDMP